MSGYRVPDMLIDSDDPAMTAIRRQYGPGSTHEMTVPTVEQPDIYDALAAMYADPSQVIVPTRRDYRDDIRRAVVKGAKDHDGLVHISWVRQYVPDDVPQHLIGIVIAALHRSGHLRWTGDYRPNGGPSGNAGKPAKVSRLVKDIDLEDQ